MRGVQSQPGWDKSLIQHALCENSVSPSTGSYGVSIRPRHLLSCFTRVARRRPRPSTSHRLEVPPVHLSTVGKRVFPVSGATVWNNLPLHVASAPSLAVFPFLPRHYHMTHVLLSPFITTIGGVAHW